MEACGPQEPKLSPGSEQSLPGTHPARPVGRSSAHPQSELIETLRRVAPGTPLREGIDSILRGQTGALIVVSNSQEVMGLLDGGFKVDAPFTAAALYELSKMDGGVVLSSDASRILYVNVQLNPDTSLSSPETGIRHRTAERLARQTGELVIAVSSRRGVITLYKQSIKYSLRDIGFILEKANEAVVVLERYRSSLGQALNSLTSLEFEDLVTVADFTTVLQRLELVLNVAEEIYTYTAELGAEGRLVSVQMSELLPSVRVWVDHVIRDYWNGSRDCDLKEVQMRLRNWSTAGIIDLPDIARLMGYPGGESGLSSPAGPRGYRILHSVPRLPAAVAENVVLRFGSLQRVLSATLEELDEVEGVGEVRAKSLKENLRRMREQSLLGRLPV